MKKKLTIRAEDPNGNFLPKRIHIEAISQLEGKYCIGVANVTCKMDHEEYPVADGDIYAVNAKAETGFLLGRTFSSLTGGPTEFVRSNHPEAANHIKALNSIIKKIGHTKSLDYPRNFKEFAEILADLVKWELYQGHKTKSVTFKYLFSEEAAATENRLVPITGDEDFIV